MNLATGSDHVPVIFELLPAEHLPALTDTRPLNFKRTDWKRFATLIRAHRPALELLVTAVKAADGEAAVQATLDDAFVSVQKLLQGALEETTPRCKGSATESKFWDAACDQTLPELRLAELDLAHARSDGTGEGTARMRRAGASKRFRKQVGKSKRSFFDDRLNDLSGNSIFAAMKWSDGAARRHRSPPMVGADGAVRVTGESKMLLLRETLLAPPPPTSARLPDLHSPLPSTLAGAPLRLEELRSAVFGHAQDRASGPDDIPFRALRAAWPELGEQLFALFETALAIDWHPRPFRQATWVALQKGGKRDPTLPRSFRLIALLPTLGKVLEKVVAVRLATLGLEHGFIASEQFGSLLGRSTADAALTLVHDVEAGWSHARPRARTEVSTAPTSAEFRRNSAPPRSLRSQTENPGVTQGLSY
ncbi:unnamed protein product [Tilletia controversa]|nr:unnamed protein product [Tilletia controversa]